MIEKGKTESRVHDAKALQALKYMEDDPEIRKALLEMSQFRLRNRGRLTAPTLIMLDNSSSMGTCIEIGRFLACTLSSIADAPLWVEAFDGESFSIEPKTRDIDGWERALARVKASGCTSLGVTLAKYCQVHYEQIVLISDGEENTAPFFGPELTEYQSRTGRQVKVFWINVKGLGHETIEEDCRRRKFQLQNIPFKGDYYNLPNLIPLLCQQQERASLVQSVLDSPLYDRDDLKRLPVAFCPKTFEIF